MEVLKPELVWVQGRCYRKLPTKTIFEQPSKFYEDDEEMETMVADVEDTQPLNQCTAEEPCVLFENEEENVPIEQASRGLQVKLKVPKTYFRFIIGKGGESKRRLESETKTSIYVPGFKEEGPIVINGKNKESILSCRQRILTLIDYARQQSQPTHFISVPFNSSEIQNSFNNFIDKILKECRNSRGLDQSIFVDPAKLHLTVAMMVLADESEIEEARRLLPTCYEQIILPFLKSDPNPSYELNGLEYMNDDPGEVDVLYAKIRLPGDQNPSKLQALVNRIAEFYASKNFVVRSRDSVKMHVTLMNTRYRRKEESVDSRSAPKRETFDARKVLEKYKNCYFGIQKFTSLYISQRHAPPSSDGYYFSTGRVDF